MGNTPSRRGLSRTALLVAALATGLTLTALPANAADPASVDSLWNQPEGIRADSGWYFIQVWWDQAALAVNRDASRRGLAELAQANAELLNAYSLLAEARTNPGPHPVPALDPFLSSAYAAVTGVQVKAPLGSLFGSLNQAMLNIEGRGSTQDIVDNLLREFARHQQAAERDLAPSPDLDSLWTANSFREQAMLAKLETLTVEGDQASLTATVVDLDHQRQDLLKQHTGRDRGQAQGNGQGQGDGHGDGLGKP